MPGKPDMAALQKAVDEAIEIKRRADQNESFARNAACDARNRLNVAQKAFDEGVRVIRDEASKAGGDWGKPARIANLPSSE